MNQDKGLFAGPGVMLFSAAIFGFFGFFYIDWSTLGVDLQPVMFRVLLGWTLKISACVFLLSGILAFFKPIVGNLLYALAGVASAVLFVVVAVTAGWCRRCCYGGRCADTPFIFKSFHEIRHFKDGHAAQVIY